MQMFSSKRANGTLEPVGFIDFVAQWLPRGEVSEVLENDLEPSLFEVPTTLRGNVRGEDRVRSIPERVIGRKWLDLVHVQGSAGYPTRSQRVVQVVKFRGHSPPDVDKQC